MEKLYLKVVSSNRGKALVDGFFETEFILKTLQMYKSANVDKYQDVFVDLRDENKELLCTGLDKTIGFLEFALPKLAPKVYQLRVRSLGKNIIVNDQVIPVERIYEILTHYKESKMISELSHDFEIFSTEKQGPMLAGYSIGSCLDWCKKELQINDTSVPNEVSVDISTELSKIQNYAQGSANYDKIKEIVTVLKYVLRK